ncbi:MgtC/SapB family protein [Fodinicurvata sp. EGI_FJ10296]|uniref:MgtC/SapB family protein n=1 Tax=Fodinicurvata sp. EGI_FJ10296 TaxID=3231908 RepID=UPI0034526263
METTFSPDVISNNEIVLRLSLAVVAGLILGLDRELRGISAGIRTHALVSLSSAVITLSALMLYAEIRQLEGDSDPDPLRAIQGLAQAIGFIGAGTIFFARGDVHNLTSAANIWMAAAVGIVAGSGQLSLGAVAVAFTVVIVTVVRVIEAVLPRTNKSRDHNAGQD